MKSEKETKASILCPSPQEVYDLFKQLNKVPRPSWHEEKAAEFLHQFAEKHHLEYQKDEHGCVVIRKPATPGYEKAKPIVLLNHMDMVCVAEKGKKFDPLNDAIESYEDNGWLKARGTSLGADNGMGLCMALAVLQDENIVHGPIECVATTNEEDGMTGAANLSPDFVKGRKIINLDSEDYDTVTVGSAAAYLQFTSLPYTREAVPDHYQFYHLNIKGGLGGHSGVDINKGRANANKLLCGLLNKVAEKCAIAVSEINGGEANNSIAVNAEALVGVQVELQDTFCKIAESYMKEVKAKYEETDSNIELNMEPASTPATVINRQNVAALIDAVDQLPYGALKMSEQLKGTVETSNSTGMVKTNEKDFFVSNYSRSFVDADVLELGNSIKRIFDEAGAKTEVIMSAPAWQSDLKSDFLKLTEDVFDDILGFRPRKVAMHFALEAGYYMQKFEGCEIVSIGPKIIEPHSITERVDMKTIDNIWKVLVELLYRLAQQ